MRIFPIVTAVIVCAVLYLVILERDRLIGFAGAFTGDDGATAEMQEVAETDAPPEQELTADGMHVVHVVARRSEATIAENAVLLRGRTEALRQVNVQSETSGLIISPPIRAGAFVEEGQLLCEIDRGTRGAALEEAEARLAEARSRLPEARARVAEARAGLTAAEIDDNAASRLSESGFGSETRAASTAAARSAAEAAIQSAEAGVETALSGIRSAEAGVERARQELTRLEIRAPFEGLLESDTAELGSLMQPGTLCATVIQLDPIKLVGFVPEAQVNRVEVGAAAGARLATGEEVQGEVIFLSRSADPQTRTFRVEIEVANADLAIRDGQTADIMISTAGLPAHLLPTSSLTLNDAGTLGVRIVTEDNRAQFVPVTMLRDTARGVLLTGLPDQATVITVGQEFVTDGVPVDVTYEELTQ
ncbi:efflux RND transporter periplasmic adaptor subunit [Rhodophyticola porphyridii]|uniref:Efflux RND transporter periplasmic adaptor subunit n=1 Tax=Rhodophyticola porphyridii TaxID=1852017 RepID=A0A3L9Y2R0_9RHOB|nr:efflux RND transporter periplasmic adaptor subunit [Rhodophyticola porphyridii]RMA41377.1 efflux RND transporter periplasmic adaptor subunit [Rhodophyticola porphyridii]